MFLSFSKDKIKFFTNETFFQTNANRIVFNIRMGSFCMYALTNKRKITNFTAKFVFYNI